MPRLLLDQGLPRSAAEQLRADAAWDVVHVGERGLSHASDAEILDLARAESRVCVTLDADFHALLALSGATGPSTVRIRIEGLDGRALTQLLRRLWGIAGPALEAGAALTVDPRSVRIRHLPMGKAAEP
ncbi:MAG: DUF5615 family PIN-like protein [Rubrivivax sp.]